MRIHWIRLGLVFVAAAACVWKAQSAEIHDAAAEGNVERVRVLIQADPTAVSSRDASGGTALHGAARKGHKAVVQLLLASKADINARDGSGLTPYRLAAGYKHLDVAALLQAPGASVASNAPGRPSPVVNHPVFFALEMRQTNEVRAMMANYPALVNVTNDTGWTPLHRAAGLGQLDMVKMFLARGAKLDARDIHGDTPLHKAAGIRNGKPVIEELLARGADVNATNRYGRTPLSEAADSPRALPNVQALLAAKADPNIASRDKLTPLLRACRENVTDIALVLLAAGANPNVRQVNSYDTPLHLAVHRDNAVVVQALLTHKADVNAESTGGSPLSFALGLGRTNLVSLLKQHGGAEKASKPLAEPEASLVNLARHLAEHLRTANHQALQFAFASFDPTADDLKKMFGSRAAKAAPIVAQEKREIQNEIGRSRPAPPSRGLVLYYVPVEPLLLPSSRKLIAPDLPLASLKEVRTDGETTVGTVYCYVNQRWVRVPSLSELETVDGP